MNKRNLFGVNFSIDQHEDGSIKATMNAELTEAGKQTVLGFIAGALSTLSDRYPDVIGYDEDDEEDDNTAEASSNNSTKSEADRVASFMNDVKDFMNKK